ncbi:uncharacterized protein [Rutidosis leptorrhynchoides]|uniref:uncharacterized protein n=1 Tax=Rutidosis leptorrhynchoides TaxID=125765 RepID=UPI003A98EF48
MSILNRFFNWGLIGSKYKTCITLALSQIKLVVNKRDAQLKLMRQEIAQFLQSGQEPITWIRVEHIIREQNIWAAYTILELFCELLLLRIPVIESQRECRLDLKEAVASIIFAAPRCSDLPDLLTVRNLFITKYGDEFIAAVNRPIIEKLSVYTPSDEVKFNVLKEIAQEYNILWDSSKTEAEFNKLPEDLLNGSKQISSVTAEIFETKSPNATLWPPLFSNTQVQVQPLQPPKADAILISTEAKQSLADTQKERPVSLESLDVLERSRVAIVAAHAANELVVEKYKVE